MDVNESNDDDMSITATANYNNNIKQDMNNEEVIPDNNFEDGFENSEIIELNDTTIDEDEDEEEFVEDDKSTDSTSRNHNNERGSGDTGAIVSNTTTALSVKVVLSKLTSTTYNTTFSGVNNCTVYYTLNGANPTTSSTKYTKSFVYDTSKTLKYFTVKANGECGAVLSMKLSEGSTPYIVYKTPITNQAQEVYISYTLPTTSIYYTINGSIPTTKSTKYNAPIKINNYTDLRFISVYGSITSNVYSYRMNAVKPVVTIKNITDVRDNYQNITIKINKAGTIYYTRNGSTPNTRCNTWTNNTKVMISIKTQVRAILIDNEGFTSKVTFYQPEKVITPPITAIRPLTTLINNKQRIQFSTNKLNCTVYYTTDGTDPTNSQTVKTAKNNDKIYINKNTRLIYYTQDDIQLYKSTFFNYTPVQHPDERPTITIINASNIWSNGQQKIIIQSNQPGKFNITKYNQTQTPTETLNNYGSYTTDTNTKIEIYTQYNTKYSKTIEYHPINGSETVMNYTYDIVLNKHNRYIGINNFDYNLIDTSSIIISKYIYYNPTNGDVSLISNMYNLYGVFIYNNNHETHLTIKGKIYGTLNQVNIAYNTFDGVEVVKVFNNEIIQEIIYIYYDKNVNHVCENITTIFNSNFNSKSIIKKELISHDSTSNSNGFEVIQSYLLTNQLINMNIFNEWLIKNNTYSVGLNKACYGTFLTALTTLHYNDMITAYYAYYFNITYSRQEDIQILVGVNINELTTVTTNDPTTGNTIYTGTTKNKFYFRLLTTLMFSECERIAVQISNQEVTSSILEFLNDAKQLKTMTFTFYNDTNIMNITTTNSKYYIELDMTTGIAKAYLNSELQYNNIHLNEFLKGAEGTEGEGGCYHDEKTDNIVHSTGKVYEVTVKKNKTVSEDEIWDKIFSEVGSFVEDSAGSMAVTAGVMLIFASGGTAIPVIGAALFVTGATACFHAAGANSLDDLTNPQIFCEGALSVTLAAVGGGELTAAKNIMKISKATTNSQLFKTTVTATIDQSGYNSAYGIADNYCKSKVQSLEIEHMHNLLTNKTGE